MVATNTAGNATTTDQRTVIGVFEDADSATQALNALRDAGFTPEQVSVIARDTRTTREMAENTDMVAEDAGKGAVVGTVLGGLAGWLVGISALAIPGIGPIVGAGIIGTTLAGAGIGAAAGGLIGALGSYGVPEEDARQYEESVRQGSVLLTVHAGTDAQVQQANTIFGSQGGRSVRSYGVDPNMTYTDTPRATGGEVRLS
jgi:uncharacterized membrane protein